MDNIDIPADDDISQFTDLFVPDIASNDPEERKLARRNRIKKRVDALQRQRQQQMQTEEVPEEKAPEKTLLQIQLEKSNEILRLLFNESEQYVTNIRVANDSREVDRREREGLCREKLLKQLQDEANLANQMFNDISEKWQNVMSYNDPLHIQDELQAQKGKCDELIKQKDTIIDMLRLEVRLAEAKYYKDMKTQNDDISNLAKRVEKQVIIMRNAHVKELQDIEDVMIQERTNMMENNDKRWEELYKKREEQELAISKNKFKQKDEFDAVTTAVRIKHMERIRDVKIRLERDHEVLQQEFEAIKTVAMANSEKMDYNYQILQKREDENLIMKSNQKRKLNKLQDIINVLRKRIDDYEKQTQYDIQKMYAEIITLQRYIADVRSKSQSMAKTNELKYMEVWELNRTMAAGILTKILNIDRLIKEQQLGLNWEEPHMKLLVKEKLPSYMEAVKIIDAAKDKTPIKKDNTDFGALDSMEMTLAYRRTLNNVLERISNKSGFFIEYRLEKILQDVQNRDDCLLRVDNVFSALGVSKILDINILLHFFRPYIRCPICSELKENKSYSLLQSSSKQSTTQTHQDSEKSEEKVNELAAVRESDRVVDEIVASMVDPTRLETSTDDVPIEEEGECAGPKGTKETAEHEKNVIQVTDYTIAQDATTNCLNNHQLVVHPGSVLKALREFVTGVLCKSEEGMLKVANTTVTISRMLESRDVIDYWERFRLVIGKHRIEVWDAVMYGLQKYHKILLDRSEVHEELKCQRRANMELNHLLKRYRKDVNDFQIERPPCARHREITLPCDPKKTGPQCNDAIAMGHVVI